MIEETNTKTDLRALLSATWQTESCLDGLIELTNTDEVKYSGVRILLEDAKEANSIAMQITDEVIPDKLGIDLTLDKDETGAFNKVFQGYR